MHFTTLGIGLIAMLAVVCAIIYRALLSPARRSHFEQEFCQAYGFTPHRDAYNNSEELLVTEKLEEAASELAVVRGNLEHYFQSPAKDSLQDALFRGMLIDQTSKSVKELESKYKLLRKLAHWAGYPWELLDELHERILVRRQ